VFFPLLLLLALLLPTAVAQATSIICSPVLNSVLCKDFGPADPQPYQAPNFTSQEDALKAQYGLTTYYDCVRETGYLKSSGGSSSSAYFMYLKACVERKAMYAERARPQPTQASSCPAGTYAQDGVCIQTVIQQAVVPAPVQAPALAMSNAEVCRNDYGPFSIWTGELNESGGATCTCTEGYDFQGGVCAPIPRQAHVEVQETVAQPRVVAPAPAPAPTLFNAFTPMDRENPFMPKVEEKPEVEEPVERTGFFERTLRVLQFMSWIAP
jgi:hypothetical protein